ncbi:hypothetical protein JW930_06190 [Candidatus Woesearchaeota archaeon]|nr:hypothetical protein [Candidatus Woesearchaeota archaeon]
MKKSNIFYEKVILPVKRIVELIVKKKTNLLIIAISIGFFLFLATRHKKIFFISILTVAGAFSLIYVRFFKQAYIIGFELCTLATVLCARAYGTLIGAVIGFLTIFFGTIISSRVKPTYFISIFTLPVIGVVASLLEFMPISLLGILMTILYDIIVLPLYVMTGSRVISSIVFSVTHIFINAYLFTQIAPFILKLMI